MAKPLSYIGIAKGALEHNCAALRSVVGKHQQIIAVVKANAYGHGLNQVVPILEPHVDGFQVDDSEELRAIRTLTRKRVLVLGYVQPAEVAEAVALGAELAIYDTERLAPLAALNQPVTLHLKIDALLGRQGLLPETIPPFLEELRRYPTLRLAGVYSHFANLEDSESSEHADAQQRALHAAAELVRKAGFPHIVTHMSSSAGILSFEGSESPHCLVRPGIALYGFYPSGRFAETHAHLGLRPVLSWHSQLAQVKELPAGHPVGYGLTYVTGAPTRLGIVPQGYSDGYPRSLSNRGQVLVGGQRCNVLGRVAMNMLAVDVTALPQAKAGDEVVLIGQQGDQTITAEELAEATGTIAYEIVARLHPFLPRLIQE